MYSHAKSILVAAALLLAAMGASAQTIYKQVDDEGRTSFTDQPPARRTIAPRRGGKIDVNEGARRLEQARQERKLGAEPQAGELTAGPRGRTVNYRYWQRQEKLRLLVERALRRSQETLRFQVAAPASRAQGPAAGESVPYRAAARV